MLQCYDSGIRLLGSRRCMSSSLSSPSKTGVQDGPLCVECKLKHAHFTLPIQSCKHFRPIYMKFLVMERICDMLLG